LGSYQESYSERIQKPITIATVKTPKD